MACKVNGKWIFQIHIMIMLKSFSEIKFQHDWSFYQRLSHIGNDMHAWESWSSNTLVIWCEEPTHWKRPRCWEWLREGGEEGNRGWDCWMGSPTWWTWVWANSGRYWRIGKPGVLQSMGSQRLRRDLATWTTEQQREGGNRKLLLRTSIILLFLRAAIIPLGLPLVLKRQETQLSILESRRSLEEGNGNPLQYSCLQNYNDRGAWQATVHRVQRVRYN